MNHPKRHRLILPLMTIMLVLLLLPTSFAAKRQTMGDVDNDGSVTAADARLVLRSAVGLESFSDLQSKLADLDKDKKITASDARLVLRTAVGLEKTLYFEGSTEPEPTTKHTDHTWDSGKVTKAATCAATGVKTYTCTVCKTTKTETIPKTTDHKWDSGKVTKAATCAATGVKTYTCTVCKTTKTETIAKTTNHKWDSGKVTKAATCVATGVKTYTCTVCKTTKTETIPKTTDHKWDSGKVTKAATCAATGVKTYICTVCKTTKTETIPKTTDHKWDSGKVTKAATCVTTGVKTYTCTVCKTTKTETIPKTTDHKWDSGKVTKAATCAATGVKTYTCSVCKTTKTETIPQLAHKWDSGKVTKEATTTSTGIKTYTCTVCKTTKTEIIPVIETEEIPDGCYEITYYLYGGQDYLKKLGVKNPNPAYYDPAKGLSLKNLSAEGYTFNGWYDSEGGDDSSRIKSIPKGTEGEIELYARWTPKTYEVTLDYDFGEVKTETYTFGKAFSLPQSPKRDGYRFISWTDKEDASVCTQIPAGTTGDKYYYANWLSNRNQAWQKKTLNDPLITEYDDVILFAYEIGEIKNVPLDVIKDFGYTMESGVKMEVNESYSASISQSQMDSLTSTVAKSTTNSFAWTLSNEWSESVSLNKEWMEQNGYTQEEAEKLCQNETNNWYASRSDFNTTDTEELGSSDNYNLSTTNDNTKTYDTHDYKNTTKESAEVDVKVKGNWSVLTVEAGMSYSGENETTFANKTGTEVDKGEGTNKGDISHTGTNTTTHGGFNTESGNSTSKSVSKETAVSKAISQLVSQTDRYGEEYINKEGWSENQGFSDNRSISDEVASSLTYSTTTATSTSIKYTINNTKSGCHRYILAGTAHVYGIVGYDISSQTYFTYTFTVMDDERHMMEDYAPQPEDLYHDHEFSGITFEIPYDIAEYVDDRIGATEGLEISEAGIVTNYTGDSQIVIVPEYISYLNKNGTRKAVKVVGISENAFRNPSNITNIGAIQLPKTVTAIPAHAFDGCTSLIYVEAPGLTSIGESAFANCSSLHVCNISDNITTLGAYVFDGMDSITVNAANANVAKAALQSGVKEINLTISKKCTDLNNTTLNVPASVTSFTFNGNDKTFTNVEIASNAAKTVISNATFVSDGKTPLKISSPEMELGQVRVNAAGIGLALSAPSTKLSLYGESTISSTTGRAMLCKSVTMSRDPESKNTTELKLTNGKLLLCGTMTDNGYLKGANGKALTIDKIEQISATDFDNYLKGVATVILNANGGTVSKSTLSCVYGSAIGTLPIPVWTYHTFTGWFTSASGGTKVTSETVCNGEMTLYAHWTENQWSDWSTTAPSGGDSVTVETKTQYRYRNKEYKNGVTQSYISGWTKTKEWVEYGSWSGNQTTTNRPSESSTLRIVDQYASAYNYYHYCCNWYDNSWCVDSIPYGNTNSTKYHTISVSSPLPAISFGDMGGKQCYGGSGSGAPACAQNFYIWFLDSVTYTYVYQTRSATTLYNHERWGDWSSWSDSYRSGQDEQTRTMYRYRVK